MSHVSFPVETPGQAKPKPPLLVFSLHMSCYWATSQGSWLIKACLRDCCACLNLLFLKFQEKPSIFHVNTHCDTSYLWPHPKSDVFNMVLCAYELLLPFLRGNSKDAQASWHQTDVLRKHSLAVLKWLTVVQALWIFQQAPLIFAEESLHIETMKIYTSDKNPKNKTTQKHQREHPTFVAPVYRRAMCLHVRAYIYTHMHICGREMSLDKSS